MLPAVRLSGFGRSVSVLSLHSPPYFPSSESLLPMLHIFTAWAVKSICICPISLVSVCEKVFWIPRCAPLVAIPALRGRIVCRRQSAQRRLPKKNALVCPSFCSRPVLVRCWAGTCPASVWHLFGVCPAPVQHLSGTWLASVRHLAGFRRAFSTTHRKELAQCFKAGTLRCIENQTCLPPRTRFGSLTAEDV